jgi:FkbM family methyltransferase
MMNTYAFVLRSDSNCVDIGAHRGEHLEVYLRHAPRGQHLAVEPIPWLAALLAERFPAVTVHNVALSDKNGTADFFHAEEWEAWSGLQPREYPGKCTPKKVTVRTARLDDLLPPDYRPHLIKVDVEGAELQVFQGMRGILRTHRPCLVFEHDSGGYRSYGTNPQQLWELLAQECGYEIFDLFGSGPLDSATFARMAETQERLNFFAKA